VVYVEVEQEEGVTVELFLEADGKRFPLAGEEENGVYHIGLSPYASRGEARICARATLNLRSEEACSEQFALPAAGLSGQIITPLEGDEWTAGQPGSLIRNLSDENGRPVAWDVDAVQWLVDGEPLPNTRSIALVGPLVPGEHTATLHHRQQGKLATVQFTVLRESAGQKAYAVLLEEYLASNSIKSDASATA